MGTRHLICAVVDGEYKIAQYGQWDGYPQGQGLGVLEFIRGLVRDGAVSEYKGYLRRARWVDEVDLEDLWLDYGMDKKTGMISFPNAQRFGIAYPQFSRDTGSEILGLVREAEGNLELQSSLEFARESLFCEWCYVLDFDAHKLEVYTGFNKHPVPPGERFYEETRGPDDSGYYPVKHVVSFDFDDLPSNKIFEDEIERVMSQEEAALDLELEKEARDK